MTPARYQLRWAEVCYLLGVALFCGLAWWLAQGAESPWVR
jgi:hypothetical protein